jgi:ankyrin repeat protein
LLIEHGADIHVRSNGGFTPLLFAAQAGDLNSARILIEAGEDVNETTPSHGQLAAWGRPDGMSPLVLAAAMGHESFGIFLLEKGANANAADLNGITPLHYTVRKGLSILGDVQYNPYANYLFRPSMVDLMKALLAHGANPNAQLPKQLPEPPFTRGSRLTTIGMTPFLLAAAAGDVSAMRVLLAGGADPNVKNAEMGRFVDFMEGEEQLCLEAIRLELELGADVNAATGRGQTALHAAAHLGVITIMQFLVDHGANLNAMDILGQSPWNMASGILSEGALRYEKLDAPHPAAAALLVKQGAIPVLAKDLPPPPESAKEAFYFRRQKGVGDDVDTKIPFAQQ